MRFSRLSSSMGLVGMDFGTRGVKMLQVREVQSGALELIGAARLDVPLRHVASTVRPPASPVATQKSGQNSNADDSGREEPNRQTLEITADSSDQTALAEGIRSAFAGGGFTGRKCVVSLAREDVYVQSVRLPKMPDDELRQTVVWEAAQRFGLDRQAMHVDFIRTGATLASGENREEVILVAASHAAIHARVEPVLAAGLRPVAVDTGFAALVRTYSRQFRRDTDLALARAVVEVGASGSTVLILRGDQIAFCKPLTISGAMLNRAVADHLQMSESEAAELRRQRLAAVAIKSTNSDPIHDGESTAFDHETDRTVFAAVRPILNELVKEITLCLRYYGVTFRGQPPDRLILTGGEGLEPKLDELIARTCKLKVMFDDAPAAISNLMGQVQTAVRSPGPAGCWAAAMGLSLRGIVPRRAEKRVSKSTTSTEGQQREAA